MSPEEIRNRVESKFNKPDCIVFRNGGYVPTRPSAHTLANLMTGVYMGYVAAVEDLTGKLPPTDYKEPFSRIC